MATNLGQFEELLPQATSLLALVGALALTWKKRAAWEPVEQDVPRGPQRVAGLVTAVVIGALWWYQKTSSSDVSGSLVSIAIACAAGCAVAVLAYTLLISIFTYEREVVAGSQRTRKEKIIGGFVLTNEAVQARSLHNITIQELLKGAGYDPDKVWTRLSRGAAKVAFSLAYMLLIGCGTVALGAVSMALVPGEERGLDPAVKKWIQEAEALRSGRTIHAGSPLPADAIAARTRFEQAWANAGLAQRKRLDPALVAKALRYTVGVYRIQEQNAAVKPNSLRWAEEQIRFFEEIQKQGPLLEALLDKAAILLDIAQLENTSRDAFSRVSQDGDAVMARAAELAGKDSVKKAEVFRISSRFYYNLARPKSFRLSDDWDNNYLLLAESRAQEALTFAPRDIRNANQLLRATMKAAKNSPQDSDPKWGVKLRDAQRTMKTLWHEIGPTRNGPSARLSPLNVLGTGTLETVAREWNDLPAAARRGGAEKLLAELESDCLPLLREAEAFLQNGELKNSHGFDIYYDLARAHAQRVLMLRVLNPARAASAFVDVQANFVSARENGKASQLDAVTRDLERDLSLSQLSPGEKRQLRTALRGER
jgi:hypothetical protein